MLTVVIPEANEHLTQMPYDPHTTHEIPRDKMNRRHKEGPSRELSKRDKWTDNHFRKLVSLYRKSPCLWKKDINSYLDMKHRHRAYDRIQRSMAIPEVTLVDIMLKIREMRYLYVKELKKILEADAVGHYHKPTFPWFYDLHEFLYSYLDYNEASELRATSDLFNISSTECSCDKVSKRANHHSKNDLHDLCEECRSHHKSPKANASKIVSKIPADDETVIIKRRSRSCHTNKKYPIKSSSCNFCSTNNSCSHAVLCHKKSTIHSPEKNRSKTQQDEKFYKSESDSVVPKQLESSLTQEDDSRLKRNKRRHFAAFARDVFCQLKHMDSTVALAAQIEIQKILTDLKKIKNFQ